MSVKYIPPALDKSLISSKGTKVTIIKANIGTSIRTSLGLVERALTIECQVEGIKEVFSYLFNLPKDVVTGSVGRILSKAGITDANTIGEADLKKIKGLELTVKNRSDKLSWY